MGVGAFSLMKRSVYDAVGGFEPLRLEIVEDIEMGRRIKSAGYRQDVLFSGDLLEVRWQEGGLWGLVRGFEKNVFASMNFSLAFLVVSSGMMAGLTLFPYAALFLFKGWAVSGYAASVLLMHTILAAMAVTGKRRWLLSLPLPFFVGVHLFTLWRSAWLTLRQGGVRWRDTFYPLEALRRHSRTGGPSQ